MSTARATNEPKPALPGTPGEVGGRSRFVEVEAGVRLHCVESGEGPLVVLLHGFPEHWRAWRRQIPALVAAGYRVVAPDLRGYNLSDKPSGLRAYRLERLALDVRALIAACGADRATVVGHDWGGAVAWQVALDHPEVVARLAVLNCPHPVSWARAMRRDGRFNTRQLLRSWYMFAFQVPWLPERLIAGHAGGFVGERLLGPARPGAFTADDVAADRAALQRPGAARAAVDYYRAVVRSRFAREILTGRPRTVRRLPMPVLLVWGGRDRALGAELVADLTDLFAGPFERRDAPEASHWVQHDAADQVNAWLLDFFARRDG